LDKIATQLKNPVSGNGDEIDLINRKTEGKD